MNESTNNVLEAPATVVDTAGVPVKASAEAGADFADAAISTPDGLRVGDVVDVWKNGHGPYAGLVAHVNRNGTINAGVLNWNGHNTSLSNIPKLLDGERKPHLGNAYTPRDPGITFKQALAETVEQYAETFKKLSREGK